MTSNYPPGVTGNEPQIAGTPECEICGYPLIQDEEAKEMGWYETGPTCGDCSPEQYPKYVDKAEVGCHRCGNPANPDAALPLCNKCIDLWHRFTEPGYGRHGYCEDYPCCGHTPDDPCDGTGYVSAEQMLENPAKYHLGCDHETGCCDYEREDDDEEDES